MNKLLHLTIFVVLTFTSCKDNGLKDSTERSVKKIINLEYREDYKIPIECEICDDESILKFKERIISLGLRVSIMVIKQQK